MRTILVKLNKINLFFVFFFEERLIYFCGGFRETVKLIDGKSRRTVFNECVSSKSCSAPIILIGLQRYKWLINFGINELKEKNSLGYIFYKHTNLTNVVQNCIKYFLDDPKWFRIIGTIVFKWLIIVVTYNDWSPTVSIVCQDNFVIAVNAGSQAFSRSWISIWIDWPIILKMIYINK